MTRLTATPEEIREILDALERDGKIIKTGKICNGRPVYKATECATEEELKGARERKN